VTGKQLAESALMAQVVSRGLDKPSVKPAKGPIGNFRDDLNLLHKALSNDLDMGHPRTDVGGLQEESTTSLPVGPTRWRRGNADQKGTAYRVTDKRVN
jgi:hypothetical protein